MTDMICHSSTTWMFAPTHYPLMAVMLHHNLPIATGFAARVEIFSRDVSCLVEVDAVTISHGLHSSKSLQANNTQISTLLAPTGSTYPAAAAGALIPHLRDARTVGPVCARIETVRDVTSNKFLHRKHIASLQSPHLPLDDIQRYALEAFIDPSLPGGLQGVDVLHEVFLEKKRAFFSEGAC